MSWAASYRKIMADMAAEQGITYDEAHDHVPTRMLLLIDRRVWWRRIRRKK